jgi:hypothetical protein
MRLATTRSCSGVRALVRSGRAVAGAIGPLIGFALAPAALAAQDYAFSPRVQWEARADALFGSPTSGQLGAGVNIPAGYYVRLGASVAAGGAQHAGRTSATARTDLVTRYLLDPFRELRWGPYAGAGLSVRRDDAHWRGYLLAIAGIEGPVRGGWRTAVEIGLGGGFRAGIVLRRARTNGR